MFGAVGKKTAATSGIGVLWGGSGHGKRRTHVVRNLMVPEGPDQFGLRMPPGASCRLQQNWWRQRSASADAPPFEDCRLLTTCAGTSLAVKLSHVQKKSAMHNHTRRVTTAVNIYNLQQP